MMKFNQRIALLKILPSNGRADPVIASEVMVWADVNDVGVTTKYTALQAGAEVTLQAEMWRKEFEKDDYTHVDYRGKRYKISQTGRTKNDLHIKLTLERG